MVDDGIRQGVYSPTVDTTLSDLKKSQIFFTEISNARTIDTKV